MELFRPAGLLQADPDSLALVYPLDPQGGRVLDLTLSADGQTLFLTTSQGEALTCAVVDTAGMTCRRRACTPSTGRTAPGQTRPPPTPPSSSPPSS